MSYDFNGVDMPKNESDIYGLRYELFVAPLVIALQELEKKSSAKTAEIRVVEQTLETKNNEIKALKIRLQRLEKLLLK